MRHKICRRCGEDKPISEYSKTYKGRSYRPDCKPCRTEIEKERVARNREHNLAVRAKYREANREKINDQNRQWYADNRDHRLAQISDYRESPDVKGKRLTHAAVQMAIRNGKLKRMPCMICGNEKTDAHHDNYSRPLDVVWLCRLHHAERHKSMGVVPYAA